ncbi:uncharacterized protein LOC126898260 [Daktulosphaira vitifoliae]|uniref:uncharacterized protein LOC126898260 n=1 Tax=Daktulosphaira vitifoliae TaxID=58002 RepID=UPI0021AAB0CD|nr:uncharacterized protein LOC126898260 [Daktulosphaira vitifoliae]
MEDILNIHEKPYFEESITKFEYHSYQPFSSNALSNNDEIRIAIQHQDLYTLPSESLLYIEGEIEKSMEIGESVSFVKLINNGIMFLFDEIRYELNSVELDKVRNPGITTCMKGYASFQTANLYRYQNAGWNESGDSKSKFEVCIPLKLIIGFAEDHRKIIINSRQELILHRSSVDINALKCERANGKIKIAKIMWRMPHINVEDSVRLKLLKTLDSRKPLYIAFRSWELFEYPFLPQTTKHSWAVKTSTHTEKPRYVIIAFQTKRKNNISADMSRFDHCSLSSLKVFLNSESYPYDSLNIDFDNDKYSALYQMYSTFQDSFYNIENCDPILTKEEFKDTAPLVVIECSKQNEKIKSAPVDVRIEFETKIPIPNDTSAYCLILHDKIFEYNAMTSEVHKVV